MPGSDNDNRLIVTPFPLALVICDFIYRDPYTSKFTLLGTFSTITGRDYPLHHPHLFVYAALTGGRGKMPLRLELVSTNEEDKLLSKLEGEVDCSEDPRAIQEFSFGFNGLIFPKAGEYRIALYANDEFMVERRLLVMNPEERSDNDL